MSRSRSYSGSRSPSPVKRRRSATPDDKELSPFLIRLFVTKGKHTPLIDFDDGKFPFRDEFHVYGWKSSTPTSLIALLYPSFPAPYRSPLARFSFRHVYVDASQRGLYRSKDLVSFSGRDLMNHIAPSSSSGAKGVKVDMDMELDDAAPELSAAGAGGKKVSEKTLDEYGFITGDYLSVSLYVPEPKGPAGPPPIGAAAGRERDVRGAPSNGEWARGEALPPRGGGRAGGANAYPPRDRRERDGGYRGAPGQPGAAGMGIRGGARRRSPSVERNGNGHGYGRRSRSPDYSRRRDRSP